MARPYKELRERLSKAAQKRAKERAQRELLVMDQAPSSESVEPDSTGTK